MAKSWYVLHTFSGQENKIEKTIQKMMDNGEFSDVLSDIKVPSEKVIDIRGGKRRERIQRILPGYILLGMNLDVPDWKVYTSKIQRLAGVSGFIGAKANDKPQPISNEEAKVLLARIGEIKGDATYRPRQSYIVSETVRIIDGPFESFTGTIEEIYDEKSRLKVMVGIFGRETPVEVEFRQVEKV